MESLVARRELTVDGFSGVLVYYLSDFTFFHIISKFIVFSVLKTRKHVNWYNIHTAKIGEPSLGAAHRLGNWGYWQFCTSRFHSFQLQSGDEPEYKLLSKWGGGWSRGLNMSLLHLCEMKAIRNKLDGCCTMESAAVMMIALIVTIATIIWCLPLHREQLLWIHADEMVGY